MDVKSGLLNWREDAGSGTTKNRERPINLTGDHLIEWQQYSKISYARNSIFKYLLLEVSK